MNSAPAPIIAARDPAPWDIVPSEPSPIPTMLSKEELRYLTWLGAEVWTGRGEVLEIGPWLGGSTRALARGLRQSPHARAGALTAVDSFIWKNFMGDRSGLQLADGDSFLPQFERNLQEFGNLVVPLPAQLPDEAMRGDPEAEDIRSTHVPADRLFRWPPGRPIEILFVDGAKSYSGLRHLLIETAASLQPGQSLLVFQDYLSWGTYWVPLIVEQLQGCLQLAHGLRHNTVSFRLRSPLLGADLAALRDVQSLETANALALLERAAARMLSLGDPAAAAILRVAKVRFLVHRGCQPESLKSFRDAERQWPTLAPDHNLERCRAWLEERLGRPLPRSWSRRGRRFLRALARPWLRRGARA